MSKILLLICEHSFMSIYVAKRPPEFATYFFVNSFHLLCVSQFINRYFHLVTVLKEPEVQESVRINIICNIVVIPKVIPIMINVVWPVLSTCAKGRRQRRQWQS